MPLISFESSSFRVPCTVVELSADLHTIRRRFTVRECLLGPDCVFVEELAPPSGEERVGEVGAHVERSFNAVRRFLRNALRLEGGFRFEVDQDSAGRLPDVRTETQAAAPARTEKLGKSSVLFADDCGEGRWFITRGGGSSPYHLYFSSGRLAEAERVAGWRTLALAKNDVAEQEGQALVWHKQTLGRGQTFTGLSGRSVQWVGRFDQMCVTSTCGRFRIALIRRGGGAALATFRGRELIHICGSIADARKAAADYMMGLRRDFRGDAANPE